MNHGPRREHMSEDIKAALFPKQFKKKEEATERSKELAKKKSSAGKGEPNSALRTRKREYTGEVVRTAVLPAEARGRWNSYTEV